MSNVSFELTVEKRADIGKGASRRLRRLNDKVPAILYGGHAEPVNLMIEHRFVTKALENEAFFSHILTLDIDGKKESAVLKAVQRHPYKARIQHLDFLRVKASDPIVMHVPLHVEGEDTAPGLADGGILTKMVTDIEIKCLPKDLPEYLSVSIAELAMDGILHLSDVKLPAGVEIIALTHGEDHDHPIVSIHMPKRVEEPTAEEAPLEASAAEGAEASSDDAADADADKGSDDA